MVGEWGYRRYLRGLTSLVHIDKNVLYMCVSRAHRFSRLPVECRPQQLGRYETTLRLMTDTDVTLSVALTAQFSKETTL